MTGLILNIFLLTFRLSRIYILGRVWYKLFNIAKNIIKNKPARIKIHGFKAVQPFDFTYPITSRMFGTFNNPLVECVYQINRFYNRKIVLFDIGAAIGDTVLLIQANCPNMINQYVCVEGDKEFFSYLKENTSCFDNVTLKNTLLSDKFGKINSLVRIHPGTASVQGKEYMDSVSFDEIAESLKIEKIDLVKIDTDGYDGKILKGATTSLSLFRPVIIFEWHPILCIRAKTDYHEHFKVLQNLGYKTFIWFTKFGNFSHFIYEPSEKYIEQFAEICIKAEFDSDWHYDVVSIHEYSVFSVLEFANSTFSRNKISRY